MSLYQDLPTTRYNTIVIDPPWAISLCGKTKHHKRASKLSYPTLDIDQIKSFPVGSLANIGAHIYLWCTNSTLREAFDVLDSWGVRYHLCMPWVKTDGIAPCMGYVFGAEYCLLGFYGKPMQRFTSIGKLNWLLAKRGGQHSAKPDEFYSLVTTMSPEPRLDCFARKERLGWSVWGNEVSTQPA